MKCMFVCAAALMAAASGAVAQDGPAYLPWEANTVFPKVARPDGGWESILEESARPSDACAAGKTYAILRVSKITGTRAGFDAAMEAHTAYYRSVGITGNRQNAIDVVTPSLADGGFAVSPEVVVTLHVNPPARDEKRAEREAARYDYDAFVDQYRANSEIVEEAWVCVPNDLGL